MTLRLKELYKMFLNGKILIAVCNNKLLKNNCDFNLIFKMIFMIILIFKFKNELVFPELMNTSFKYPTKQVKKFSEQDLNILNIFE